MEIYVDWNEIADARMIGKSESVIFRHNITVFFVKMKKNLTGFA